MLVLTFLLVKGHAKGSTLDGTFEFQKNLSRAKGVEIGEIVKALRRNSLRKVFSILVRAAIQVGRLGLYLT